MDELATCPFCQFSHSAWEAGHPQTHKGDWGWYAPVEIMVFGYAAIECKNCGVVVVDTRAGCIADAWNILSAQATR